MATSASLLNPRSGVKLDTIAVLTDFSIAAENGLRYAASLCRTYSSELLLIHAYYTPISASASLGVMTSYDPQLLEENNQLLEREMTVELEALFLKGIRTQAILRCGTVAQVMEETPGVDLIVIGTEGLSGFRKALTGSTAETIFRSSKIPVLTVGPHCFCSGARGAVFRTILFATDCSESTSAALPYAVSIANDHLARLALIHVEPEAVAELSFERATLKHKGLEDMYKLVPLQADSSRASDYIVAFGETASIIVEKGKELGADLIVMGVNGFGTLAGASSHFSGGTTYRVAVEAHCPVLTVRALDR